MHTPNPADLAARIDTLKRRLRRTRAALVGAAAILPAMLLLGAAADDAPEIIDEIRARRILVVDANDVVRVAIGEDTADIQRRSKAAGLTIYGIDGAERGGFGTFADDSVVLALDAPVGVGAAMRDRLGLSVSPAGAARILLIDNETKGVVALTSDGQGAGGLQHFDWHTDEGFVNVKTVDYEGETVEKVTLGGQ